MSGAIAQGSIGIGFALIAGPVLMSIDGSFAPGPMIVASQVISVRHAVVEREALDRGTMRNLLFGLPVGLIAGIVTLEMMSDRVLAILVGGLAAFAAAILLMGVQLTRTQNTDVVGGAMCAFASVTAALPGPPLVLCLNNVRPAAMRATVSSYVLVVAAIGFVSLLLTGNFGGDEVELTLWLLPGIFGGLFLSRWVRPYLERSWFRPLVLVMALCGGLGLVIRQFV